MDIKFSSKAKNPDDSVCFNSTGVGAQNLDYPDVVPPSGTSSAERVTSGMGMLVAVMVFAGVAFMA